jgi:antitoxin CcdA
MIHAYDYSAPKKPTNLSINSDLLAKAKALKLNLSATLEIALEEQVQKVERDKWLKQNQAAIEASNKLVEEHGLFSDFYRTL